MLQYIAWSVLKDKIVIFFLFSYISDENELKILPSFNTNGNGRQ